jgi:hypothetical protein
VTSELPSDSGSVTLARMRFPSSPTASAAWTLPKTGAALDRAQSHLDVQTSHLRKALRAHNLAAVARCEHRVEDGQVPRSP